MILRNSKKLSSMMLVTPCMVYFLTDVSKKFDRMPPNGSKAFFHRKPRTPKHVPHFQSRSHIKRHQRLHNPSCLYREQPEWQRGGRAVSNLNVILRLPVECVTPIKIIYRRLLLLPTTLHVSVAGSINMPSCCYCSTLVHTDHESQLSCKPGAEKLGWVPRQGPTHVT